MRISLNWLNELVDITLSPEELADVLTMAGFEVEDIEDRRTWADGVVIGRVLQRDPHPDADKLSVCQVDIGTDQPSTIVCGAANVQANLFVPVATVGSYLPKVDLKIRPRKLRGVPSEGMICSLSELGLEKESDGIHVFTGDSLKPGQDVRPYLGLDDVVLDLTSTANRADALSMVGIAREVAAITGAALHLPEVPLVNTTVGTSITLAITEREACPIYQGTRIQGVQIAPSPKWLQQRLQAAGTRPINNVVDITNYVLLEWGQPLHAFDADRLQTVTGSPEVQLGVRFAQGDETLTTLDGQARSLSSQALVITANDHPVALAGVMGGAETEVHAQTQNLVLEAAWFEPATIRRSARSQSLRTEASSRYERGVNPAGLAIAAQRALHLIMELAGGTVGDQALVDDRPDHSQRIVTLRLERVNDILGPIVVARDKAGDASEVGELQAADIERILTALGCDLEAMENDGEWQVSIPPYRDRDLQREIDLIEEVARLYGYNNFCDTLPDKSEAGYLSFEQTVVRKLKAACQAVGLTELIHYSLVKAESGNQVALANPLLVEYSALRTELLPGLMDAFQYNLEQGNGALNGFEIGRVFWRDEDGFDEMDRVGGILGGDARQNRWTTSGQEAPMTWYDAKGVLESLFDRLGLTVEYQPDRRNSLLHPGRTASLWIHGNRLGTFGQLHPQICEQRGLPNEVYGFELDLDAILDEMNREELVMPIFQPYSVYPASDRDIAFDASLQTSVVELERVMLKAGGALLESVALFDDYRGQNVPDGKRSLAFRLVYRASDRTLTDEEVETTHRNVRDALVEKFGVEPRS
ncbi:MAG TPA: phenylalanine--tRNA ligase subunit beta [Candidatus Obscuribacterales bacterium]